MSRRFEFAFRLYVVFVDDVKAAKQQVIVNVIGLKKDDLAELLDCQLQNFRRLRPALHVAQRTKIDSAQQLARVEIVRIALDDLLRLSDRVADVASLEVELG